MEFEWNPEKERANLRKHRVSFEEAQTVFGDPMFITVLDVEHSITEDRYITIGQSNRNRILLIAHAEKNGRIRIISAREVTRHERNFYTEGL